MRRVVRTSIAALLGVGVAAAAASTAVAAEGDIARVSVADNGAQSATGGFRTAISADGARVGFLSPEALTGVPTGGVRQMWVRDVATGHTVLASSNAAGQPANADVEMGDPFNPFMDLSGNGRYAVFVSTATNLVANDANGAKADVFRKDLQTGAVEVVSLTPAGQQGDESVPGDPSISYDGTRVAFTTGTARAYVAGDVSNESDVVVRDTLARTTTLVSRTSAGQQANGFCERPSISADGRVVAFEAGLTADNLIPNDTNATNDIAVHVLATGATSGASFARNGDLLGGNMPDISGDGRFVAFQSGAALDPGNDVSGGTDVYVRDRQGAQTVLASARTGLTTGGDQGGGQAAISADGDRVAFASSSTNLITGDANNQADVFVRGMAAQRTARASQRADGGEGNNGAETPSIAGSGVAVAFATQSAFDAVNDTNAADDVYRTVLAAAGDTTAPALTATAAAGPAGTVRVSGSVAADPSGIGQLTVNGATVRVAPDDTFSVDIPSVGATTTAAVAVADGAGNGAQRVLTYTAPTPAGTGGGSGGAGGGGAGGGGGPATGGTPGTARIAVTAASARVAGTRVRVAFRLSRAATVRMTLQRAVRIRPGRVRFVAAAPPVTRRLTAGRHTVALAAPRRAGAYRVSIRATAAGRVVQRTAAFRVR